MRYFTTIIFAACMLHISAQDRFPAEIAETQININILQPSLSFEKRLSDKKSLVFIGGLTTLAAEDFNDDIKFGLTPFVQGEFRHYYPRKRIKKELNPNSGNYVGLVAGYNFGTIADNLDIGVFGDEKAFYMGPVWGIQRNYKSGIHLGLSLGAGFITGSNTDFDFHGVGSFELGFVISTK